MGAVRSWRRLLTATVAATGAVVVVAAPGAAAAVAPEGEVHVPTGAAVAEGRYIVALKPSAGPSARSAASSVAARYGAQVQRTYSQALQGFAMTASAQQARRLAADPRVARVEADAIVVGAESRPYPLWNLDLIDQRSSVLDDTYTYPDSGGSGVSVYIMDTGVRTTHSQFGDRASVGFDAIGDGWNGQDCNADGHGTHVAGTVGGSTYGVAPQARLVSVRVLGCNNRGLISQIIAGVDWVTQNAQRPAVVNMSLGGSRSQLQESAITTSIGQGITYVVSAGNWNANACDYSPAALPAAITVAASNSIGERATGWGGSESGSNYGSCVDLFAPGENIRSAHNATDRASRVLRGTSMASPHVAGAAALLLALRPEAMPAEVTSTLIATATPDALRPSTLSGSPNRLLNVSETMDAPALLRAR